MSYGAWAYGSAVYGGSSAVVDVLEITGQLAVTLGSLTLSTAEPWSPVARPGQRYGTSLSGSRNSTEVRELVEV